MKKIICAVALVISNSTYAEEWNFDAVLNDKVIGQHTFIYEDEKTISNANFKFDIDNFPQPSSFSILS